MFGECCPTFKFFHQMIHNKILYVYITPHLQYVATLPCESRKSNNVTDFDTPQQTVDMFLRTL